MIFGIGFLFSCLAIMFFLHFRSVQSGEGSLMRRWVNSAGRMGEVLELLEGDTLLVRLPEETVQVRLNAVDTPPPEDPGGDEALAFVRNLVEGKPVRVLEFFREGESGLRGEVYNHENVSLNEALMKAGWAWYYKPHSENNPYYEELNRTAQTERIGLWADGEATPPWERRAKARELGIRNEE